MDASSASTASSPLSFHSRSPTPPSLFADYPSPPSSQHSSNSSPLPEGMDSTAASADEEGPRPRKRRKTEPKPRTTQYLDLRSDQINPDEKPLLDRLMKALHKKRKIVVIAGAGISVSAGIPDFRSSNGLFQTLRGKHSLKSSGKELFDASVYKDSKSTASFHAMVCELYEKTRQAQPTPFHHLLATLAHDGRLLRLYSQNVDGIDTKLPPLATNVPLTKPWPKTIQVHGGLDKMVCSKCQNVSDFQADLFQDPIPPPCSDCQATDNVRTEHAGKRSHGIGKLRPRMVLYNEHNPDAEAIGSVTQADLRARPDVLIVAGTTLKIPGVRRIVREMCNVVRDKRDGITVWINNDPEPSGKDLENCWDIVIRGPCDEVARHAAMRKWTDDKADFEACLEVSEEHVNKVKEERGLKEIPIISPSKSRIKPESEMMLTPMDSPTLQPLEGQAAGPEVQPTLNSASRGKKIAAILPQGNTGLQSKSKPPKSGLYKPKASRKNATAKPGVQINTLFPATKPKAKSRAEKGKGAAATLEPLSTELCQKTISSLPQTPMAQGPPQQVCAVSSPLSSPPVALDKPSPLLKTLDDTIFPDGALPTGFTHLLSTPSPTQERH